MRGKHARRRGRCQIRTDYQAPVREDRPGSLLDALLAVLAAVDAVLAALAAWNLVRLYNGW